MAVQVKQSAEDKQRDRVRAQLRYPKGAVERGEDGTRSYLKPPHATLSNLEIIIGQDPAFYPFLGYNEFTSQVTWNGQPLTDATETAINLQVQALYDLHMSTERVREMVAYIAAQHPYHPVREWLRGLTWDGVPRLDSMLHVYADAADSKLHAAMGRRFMLGAVARIMRPGCQLDTTLILVGAQGVRKSSLFRALVEDPTWFSDTTIDLRTKDVYQQLQGVWLYEVAELAALRGRDAESTKAFLTSRCDRYRPPYGRNVVRWDRQVAFVGTTNEAEFLDDKTGARRFWPVKVGAPDVEAITRDRAQLWAEAVEAFDAGDPWWLLPDEEAALVESQQTYQRADSWADMIAEWMAANGRQGATVRDLLTNALGLEASHHTHAAAMRVGSILAGSGYVKRRGHPDSSGHRPWLWVDASSTVEPSEM